MSKTQSVGWNAGRSLRLWTMTAVVLVAAGSSLRAGDGRIPVYQAGTLGAPGTYYLTQNITSGAGIVIGSDNVTLDLNGHLLVSTGTGISSPSHTNVRITNGSVSSSNNGISATMATGGFVQIDHVTIVSAVNYGIFVSGPSSTYTAEAILEDNTVLSVNPGFGIYAAYLGSGRVRSNLIRGVVKTSTNGTGMSLQYCSNMTVNDNVVSGNGGNGLLFSYGANSTVTGNTCSLNGSDGLYLYLAPNCSVIGNTAAGNPSWGLEIYGTGTIYANNHAPGNTNGGVFGGTGTVNGGGNLP